MIACVTITFNVFCLTLVRFWANLSRDVGFLGYTGLFFVPETVGGKSSLLSIDELVSIGWLITSVSCCLSLRSLVPARSIMFLFVPR